MSLSSLQQLEAAALMPTYRRLPVEFVRGEGAVLWDSEGREYLDLLAGIAVDNAGHCHPAVVDAIQRQAAQLIHVSNLFYTAPGMELAARLSATSLGGKVFLCNSGAEANEAAIKLARRHRPAGGFVVFNGAFHGRTMGALSATPQEEKQAPFAPLVPGFTAIETNADLVRGAVSSDTAAVIVEPIQGEGGIWPVPDEVLVAAREACDETGALLIFDEVQTGAGRTGTLWGYQGTPVEPDVMTLAKGLGGGLPMGAVVTAEALGSPLQAGDHGSTFAGGPVASVAALASLDVVSSPALLAEVRANGKWFTDELSAHPAVRAVRGRGLMIGADISGDAPAIVAKALEHESLVINATGPHTLRFVPPLVITSDQLADAVERLTRLLDAA